MKELRNTGPFGTPVKLLLVDDTLGSLLALEAALQPLGEELVLAHSGREALRHLLNCDFAAILLDVRMPDMDGFETAEMIRMRPQSRSTPILFLTAYTEREALSRGYGLGAVDFLYKPIVPEILRSKVGAFVELARKADELRRDSITIQRQERRFRSMLEVAPDAIVITRGDGAVAIVNSRAEALFCYSRQDLIARNIRTLIPGWQYLFTPCTDDETNTQLTKGTRRGGTTFAAEINLSPLETDEGLMIIHVIRDITERTRIEEQQREAEQQLRTANETLRALSASLQSAREEEASRIAREVHDELGASLSSLKWDLETVHNVLSEPGGLLRAPALRQKILGMINLAESTVTAVRRIASELRPSILDDLGLLEALEWQTQQFQLRTGITCHFSSSLEHTCLNRDQSTAVFRIAQEALTNVLRHAAATTVEMIVEEGEWNFVLRVQDDGRGIRSKERTSLSSMGILGMQERARLVGGTVNVAAGDFKGTLVTVHLPISDVSSADKGSSGGNDQNSYCR